MAKCSKCEDKECYIGKDCFKIADKSAETIDSKPELLALHKAATTIEGTHYCNANRLQEIVFFAREMNYKKLGIAFCVGLAEEARILEQILSKEFEVDSVCCKIGGIKKKKYDLKKIRPNKDEVMCNPFGQAQVLNDAGTELNLICGLCVGHEAIFVKQSDAPIVSFITKDRVTGHNPAAALYCKYLRGKL